MRGWNCSVLSSWKLETSRTDQVSSVLSSMSAMTGTPMLPPTSVGNAGLLEDFADERRGGGLAVGAGDGEDLAFQEAGGEFEFADDGAAEVACLHQLGCIERHAGADDDEVLAAEGEQAVTAGFDVDAFVEQGGNVFGERFGAANVGDGDLGSATAQKQWPRPGRIFRVRRPELFCL